MGNTIRATSESDRSDKMKTTRYGIPCIKLLGGEYIQIGRLIRFLAGIAVIVALLAGWIEAHDKIELGMWIVLALLLIDPALITTAVSAVKAVRNGKK